MREILLSVDGRKFQKVLAIGTGKSFDSATDSGPSVNEHTTPETEADRQPTATMRSPMVFT